MFSTLVVALTLLCAHFVSAPALARQGEVFYVNGNLPTNGSGSELDPFNTLSSVPARERSQVFVAGVLREGVQWTGLRRGTVVRQWPGEPQAELRGDVVVPPQSWMSSNGLYYSVLSVAPASVVWNWDENVDALGRHFGHLREVGSIQQCRDIAATWYFDSPASRVYLHPPPGAQRPDQGDVYAWVRTGSGLTISNGDGLTIDGLHFRLWSDPNPGNGYGIKCNDGVDAVISNCLFEDCGYHSAGFVGDICRNNRFISCVGRGLHGRSNHFVFYAATNDVIGCRAEYCEAHLYGILDWQGNPLDISDRVGGYYTHTGGGGAAVRDLEFFRCKAIGYAGTTGNAFGAGQTTPSVLDGRNVDAYPVRYVECVAENCDFANVEGFVSFVRCRFDFRRAADTGGITHSCLMFNRSGTQVAIQSSEFITRLDGTNASRAIWVKNPGDTLYLLGVTFYDEYVNGANRSFIRAGDQAHVIAEQCVFVSTASAYLTNGATSHTPDNFDFLNCWYFGIGAGRYSSSPELNERGEWAVQIDRKGRYDADPEFTRPPLDLSPRLEGPLWRMRVPLSGVSRFGISGITYDGRLGAYQYGWPIAWLIASPCPSGGTVKLKWNNARRNGTVAVLYSDRLGNERIPRHLVCGGLQLDLGLTTLIRAGTAHSDSQGNGEITGLIRPVVCGGYVQMIDIESCASTNIVPIE